jgi:hypothetical protein
LAVADHVFIFHVKSASYGHVRRKALSLMARARLDAKHGAAIISRARASLDESQHLALIRRRIAVAFKDFSTGRTGNLQLSVHNGY